jgi:hypothetical protein
MGRPNISGPFGLGNAVDPTTYRSVRLEQQAGVRRLDTGHLCLVHPGSGYRPLSDHEKVPMGRRPAYRFMGFA